MSNSVLESLSGTVDLVAFDGRFNLLQFPHADATPYGGLAPKTVPNNGDEREREDCD